MKYFVAILVLFVLVMDNHCHGQVISIDSDFITWKVDNVKNTSTSATTQTGDWFKSSPDSLLWVHNNGKESERLHIDSKFQTWLDISEDGSVSFQVIWRKIPGKITFRRENGEAVIVTEFVRDNVNVAPYEYKVSSVIKD